MPQLSYTSYSSDRQTWWPFPAVWRHRELLGSLIERNLKVKYQRSVIGFVWTLMNPLLIAGVLILVFSHVIRIPVEHYWALLLSGYFAWNFNAQMLNAGPLVLIEHAGLRRAAAFPSEVLLFAAASARLVEFLIELTLAVTLIAIFHHGGVPASLIMLPLLVLLLVLITMGLTMLVCTLAVFYYDVQHILPIGVLALFYLSPVFYPASMVPESFRAIYFLNPFAGLLTLFHHVLYFGEFPPARLLALVSLAAVVIAAVGYALFARRQSLFAEIV
jgi:lipopolysaccharide transport system permease protein